MNKKFQIILLILAIIILVWVGFKFVQDRNNLVKEFEKSNQELTGCDSGSIQPDGTCGSDIVATTTENQTMPTTAEEGEVAIYTPETGQTVTSPLLVNGKARGNWFFEATFPAKIVDETGRELGSGIMKAEEDWMTEEFIPFSGLIEFNYSTSTTGSLILRNDNPSGLSENEKIFTLPIKFSPSQEKIKINVYFNNDILDPEVSCTKVFSVEREIDKTLEVARAAIEELIKGPSAYEKSKGYFTSLKNNPQIQVLTIENGQAKIDFNEDLEKGIGGSCWVSAIRAQIEETLKQFTSVSEVIISIDGRTEDILQP